MTRSMHSQVWAALQQAFHRVASEVALPTRAPQGP